MSLSEVLSLPIVVPTTCIKKPGFLKSVQCVSSSPCSLPNLLEEFKTKAELEVEKESKDEYLSLDSIPKRQREPMDSISLNVQRYYSEHAMMTPGKNKKLSDEKSGLILIAQKILAFFDIKLVAEVSNKKSKSVFNILKVLIPEMGLFSTQFFSDLKITEFVFVDGESSPTSSGNNQCQATFDVKHLDSSVKVLQRLYRVIFNSLLLTKPQIFNEWFEYDCRQGKVERSESLTKLEETFLAIMNDLNRVSMKPRIQVLKVLLTRYCAEMTDEWFKIRNLDKKKHTKVSFSLDEW